MAILKVARMGHPVLRKKARPVEKHDIKSALFQRFIDDMIATMHEYAGVGLAAPQVHESVRLFVAHLDEDGHADGEPQAVLNPEITIVGDRTVDGWEGCLSVPDVRGTVPRAFEISVRGLDRYGKRIDLAAKDFPARVIQHETDHLDGVLFFDRMTSLTSLTYMDEFSRYHAKRDDEEHDGPDE